MSKSRRFFIIFIIISLFLPLLFGCGGNDTESVFENSYINLEESTKADNSEDNSVSDEVSNDNSDSDDGKKELKVLFDSSNLGGSSPFLPSYAPFSLYDTTIFSDTIITSISFPFSSLASGYTADSEGLIMPIYVIKNDFSSKKSDCTIENGKKIELDFTGKLDGIKSGDWLTVDGLNIVVSENETLAFGDPNMAVLPAFLRNDSTHGFYNKVFDSKGQNNHSLIFKIEGYSLKNDSLGDIDDGKTYISFLGDSISTYSGWSNNTSHNNSIGANAVWYPNNNYTGANLKVEDTWWHRTLTGLDYELAVNNSWSGSLVTNAQTYNIRAKNLHNTSTGARPDIVIILMGVNDFAAGTEIGNYDGTKDVPTNPSTFSEAYGRLLHNIFTTYKDVEVYCCTFLPDLKRFSSIENANGVELSDYNDAIIEIAENMGAKIIDLNTDINISASNITQYTVDRLHPNSKGMELIADIIINAIEK